MKTLNNVLIFGDSYSTFGGYIPEGFRIYYDVVPDKTGDINRGTDLNDVTQTWWYQVIEQTGSTLIQNNSWSGSTVCYTGYEGDCSRTSSFIYRLEKLEQDGFFDDNKIDTVFIFGGTNDCWAGDLLGDVQLSDWKREDLFSFLPAYCYMLHRLKEILPDAEILCIGNCDLKDEFMAGIKDACAACGVKFIQLTDIEKISGHPTVAGMKQITGQILDQINKK